MDGILSLHIMTVTWRTLWKRARKTTPIVLKVHGPSVYIYLWSYNLKKRYIKHFCFKQNCYLPEIMQFHTIKKYSYEKSMTKKQKKTISFLEQTQWLLSFQCREKQNWPSKLANQHENQANWFAVRRVSR